MAKKYDFTQYRMNTDEAKASPVLEHDFTPVDDDKDIVVHCTHFRAGEKMGFASMRQDGTFSFDYRRIFERKVQGISGLKLTVTDARTGKPKELEVTDAETLLSFPDTGIASEIVTRTALHLISGDSLTEEEQGN